MIRVELNPARSKSALARKENAPLPSTVKVLIAYELAASILEAYIWTFGFSPLFFREFLRNITHFTNESGLYFDLAVLQAICALLAYTGKWILRTTLVVIALVYIITPLPYLLIPLGGWLEIRLGTAAIAHGAISTIILRHPEVRRFFGAAGTAAPSHY